MASEADRLRAQAQGGQLGLRAYDQAQANIRASQAEAARAALEGSATRGAPSAARSAVESIVSSPASYYSEAAGIGRNIAGRNVDAARAAAAAYQSSVGRTGGLGSTRRAASSAAAQAALGGDFARYGGYGTSGEFDNAATGGALMLQDQLLDEEQANWQQAIRDREFARQAGSYEARGRRELADAARGRAPEIPAPLPRPAVSDLDAHLAAAAALDPGAVRAPVPTVPTDQAAAANAEARRFASQARLAAEQSAAAQDAARLAAVARADEAREPTVEDALAALEQQAVISSPQALQDLRYQFATEYLGADPIEALGRFAPMTPQEVMQSELDMAETAQAYEELLAFGPGGMEAAAADMFAENTEGFALDPVARAVGMDPMLIAAHTSTPGFQEAMLEAFEAPDPIPVLVNSDRLTAAILAEMLSGLDPSFASRYQDQLAFAAEMGGRLG